MCLGIPGRVVETVEGSASQFALVDIAGTRRTIDMGMLEVTPAKGDWVLVHMGIALELIGEAEAEELVAAQETADPTRKDSVAEEHHV